MRMFVLFRNEDVTGISGTGVVAEGAEFSGGKCVLAWTTEFHSVAVYDSMAELIAIHGHDGRTEIRYTDALAKLNLRLQPMEMDVIWRGINDALTAVETRLKASS